jgi:hypothetical protein
MRKLLVFVLISVGFSTVAAAEPKCGRWISQSNGWDWRMCFDEHGNKYCELRKRNNLIVPIRCP